MTNPTTVESNLGKSSADLSTGSEFSQVSQAGPPEREGHVAHEDVVAPFASDFEDALHTSSHDKKQPDAPFETSYPKLSELIDGKLRDGRRYLSNGDRGEDVTELQHLLKAAGFDPGSIDGAYGPNTQAAVDELQASSPHLRNDGKPGPQTLLEAYRRANQSKPEPVQTPQPAVPPQGNPERSKRDTVTPKELQDQPLFVDDVQKFLNQTFGSALSIDGEMGQNTRFAIAVYQLSMGLSANGRVDQITLDLFKMGVAQRSEGMPRLDIPFDYTLLPKVESQMGFMNGEEFHFTGRRLGDFVMQEKTAEQFVKLLQKGLNDGVFLQVTSAFRSNEDQARQFHAWRTGQSRFIAAPPGRSNHQSGIAIDIQVGGFGGSVYQWMTENAGEFGFMRTVVGKNGEAHHWEYRGPGSVKTDPRFRDGVR